MKRILLIEDDYDLSKSILMGINVLEIPGLQNEVCYDGSSALERVKSSPAPDLIILDMHLPHVAGQDIYQAARRENPDCKIIIITADMALAREIRDRQAAWKNLPAPERVFTKPFSLIEFLDAAKSLLAE
jgi:DNA-binding response OmpR family regulator